LPYPGQLAVYVLLQWLDLRHRPGRVDSGNDLAKHLRQRRGAFREPDDKGEQLEAVCDDTGLERPDLTERRR